MFQDYALSSYALTYIYIYIYICLYVYIYIYTYILCTSEVVNTVGEALSDANARYVGAVTNSTSNNSNNDNNDYSSNSNNSNNDNKRRMGSALMWSLQISYFLTEGLLGFSR